MAAPRIILALFSATALLLAAALPENSTQSNQVNSNSVLVALIDSRYTELAELVEKALLLQTLEDAVANHNVTIFAPKNEALERDLDPEFKRFLLEPRNLRSLQKLLLSHIVPDRIALRHWPAGQGVSATRRSLSGDRVQFTTEKDKLFVGDSMVVHPHAVDRCDGVIHGIDRLIIPRAVQEDFNRRRSLRSISAIKPEGAPEVDPRKTRLKKPATAGSPPSLPIYAAMAPGPSLRRRAAGEGLHPNAPPLRRIQRDG